MHVIRARNVNDALVSGMTYLSGSGAPEHSRNGDVLVAPGPVTTVYARPYERVLFHTGRDANPFFHLGEAIWMLAGSNDPTFLNLFVKDFGERYAEPDGTLHGAYGHRWRKLFYDDQIVWVIGHLMNDPTSRRAVLQMWDAGCDTKNYKDIPCNTQIYFRLNHGDLDMTVTCRSNDIIWGAYGANAVHMSFLQEFIAAALRVPVGTYYQISNNFHGYLDVFDKLLAKMAHQPDPYMIGQVKPKPIKVAGIHDFLYDCERVVAGDIGGYRSTWMEKVWFPVSSAHRQWREGNKDLALRTIDLCEAPDWRQACRDWMWRRL